jgi:hypothetical protein
MVVSDLREFDAWVSLAGPSIVDRISRVVDVDADNATHRQLSSPTPKESLAVRMCHCRRDGFRDGYPGGHTGTRIGVDVVATLIDTHSQGADRDNGACSDRGNEPELPAASIISCPLTHFM